MFGDIDVDTEASANIPCRGYPGHQRSAAIANGLQGEILRIVVEQSVHDVGATVAGEVLVAVDHAGNQCQALAIDVFLVDGTFGPAGLRADPTDGASGYFHAYFRDSACPRSID